MVLLLIEAYGGAGTLFPSPLKGGSPKDESLGMELGSRPQIKPSVFGILRAVVCNPKPGRHPSVQKVKNLRAQMA